MSLDLDQRQRAMLQEMGLRVWLPAAVLPAPEAAQALPGAAQARPAVAPTASAFAIENIAINAINMRAAGQKASETRMPARSPAGSAESAPAASSSAAGVLAAGIATMDWPALAHSVADCQACRLCSGRRAPVFGAGAEAAPRQADWLLVGEPPDEAEERLGAPFAAQAGQLLDNMLKALGLSRRGTPARAAAYVSNVVKCRPALVRNPEPAELAICEHYLQREVALVQPKVILALGRFAAQTLLQGSLPDVAGTPLGKLRGQIYRYQGIPVLVSYHPDYLLRTPQDKARAWADWCLALDVVRRAQ